MFARHLRGETPIITAVLGYGVLGTIVMIGVGRLLLSVAQHLHLSLALGSAVDLAWLAFCCLVWLWAAIGIWRSSNQQANQAKWSSRFIVLLASLLLVPTAIASSKAARELAHLAVGSDPLGNPAEVRAAYDRIIVEGTLAQGSADVFERVLRTSRARMVTLDSPGGRISEAREIAGLVKNHGLDTEVDLLCASACTLILLAGKRRSIGSTARVGFHQSTFAGNASDDDDFETESVRSYFRAEGVAEEFITKAFSTSAKTLWYPSEDEMLEARFLNRRGINVILTRAVVRLADSLPRRIDRATVLRYADAHESTLTYHYQLTLPEIDGRAFRTSMTTTLRKQACDDAGLRTIIQYGAALEFVYVDSVGRHIATISVKDCGTSTARRT